MSGFSSDPASWPADDIGRHYIMEEGALPGSSFYGRPPDFISPPVTCGEGFDILVIEERCCDLHGRNCEPPSELCCKLCTEATHPGHADGSVCSNPDLSSPA